MARGADRWAAHVALAFVAALALAPRAQAHPGHAPAALATQAAARADRTEIGPASGDLRGSARGMSDRIGCPPAQCPPIACPSACCVQSGCPAAAVVAAIEPPAPAALGSVPYVGPDTARPARDRRPPDLPPPRIAA